MEAVTPLSIQCVIGSCSPPGFAMTVNRKLSSQCPETGTPFSSVTETAAKAGPAEPGDATSVTIVVETCRLAIQFLLLPNVKMAATAKSTLIFISSLCEIGGSPFHMFEEWGARPAFFYRQIFRRELVPLARRGSFSPVDCGER